MPYEPDPIDTAKITLPADLNDLLEFLARNTHEAWAAERRAQGWTYGPKRDDVLKHHPCLIPYEELPESEKEFDRITAAGALKVILKLGYDITKRD